MECPMLKDPKCSDVIHQACTQFWSMCDRLNFNYTSIGLFLKKSNVVSACCLHLVVHIFFKTLCLLYTSSKKCMQSQGEQAINGTGYKDSTWWGGEQVAMPTMGGLVNSLHQQYWVRWWTDCMQWQQWVGWWTGCNGNTGWGGEQSACNGNTERGGNTNMRSKWHRWHHFSYTSFCARIFSTKTTVQMHVRSKGPLDEILFTTEMAVHLFHKNFFQC